MWKCGESSFSTVGGRTLFTAMTVSFVACSVSANRAASSMLRIGMEDPSNVGRRAGLTIPFVVSPSITQQMPISKNRPQISRTREAGISSLFKSFPCRETYAPPPATMPSKSICSKRFSGIFPRDRPELIQMRCPCSRALRSARALFSEVVGFPQTSVPSMSRNTAYLILSRPNLPDV